MAKHTTVTITNELDFIGRIWQPGIGPCFSRARPSDADVIAIQARAAMTTEGKASAVAEATTWKGEGVEPMRQACYEWLASNQGDFSEIIDFYADFGEPGSATFYASEWHTSSHEIDFEDADGYDLEPGETAEGPPCIECGEPATMRHDFASYCAACAAKLWPNATPIEAEEG